jgi:hypothetical protein
MKLLLRIAVILGAMVLIPLIADGSTATYASRVPIAKGGYGGASPVPQTTLTTGASANDQFVGILSDANGSGYWLVASDGGVFTEGGASFHGSAGSMHLNRPIVGMAATPDGNGYWLVGSDGGVFSFGDASFHGSTGSMHLNRPIVGMAATPDGHGYWLVASDGGVFSFGDASFHGSTGSMHLNRPIVGMAADPDGNGYWLVASDGGVFSFGAPFLGSAITTARTTSPFVSMATTNYGNGYKLVSVTGAVSSFSNSIGSSGNPLPALGVNYPAVRFISGNWQAAFTKFSHVGSSWVRVDVPWPSLEPSQGTLDAGILASMSEVVAYASNEGMSVLFTVLGTPSWDQPSNHSGANASGSNLPPANNSYFAAAMAAVAARFAGEAVAWEIWNEPNEFQNFAANDPSQYVTMACAAYHAIKAVAPKAIVAVGALSGEATTWLAGAYSDGLHGCFDVISLHLYDRTLTPEPANWQPPVSVASDRQLMVDNGDSSKAIWITEFGWYADPNTADPLQVGAVTPSEQANYSVSFINQVGQNYPYVPVVMIYNGADAVGNSDPAIEFAGILDGNLNPKPVYGALSALYNG